MEIAMGILVALAVLVVGIGVSTAVLVFASGLAASKQLDARQALIVVLLASFVNAVVQVGMAIVGISGLIASGPVSLAVWTLTISAVGQLRLGESFITSVVMTVIQTILGIGLAMGLVAVGLGLGGMQ